MFCYTINKILCRSLLYCQLKNSKIYYQTVYHIFLKEFKAWWEHSSKKKGMYSQNVFVIYIFKIIPFWRLFWMWLKWQFIYIQFYAYYGEGPWNFIMVMEFHWFSNRKCRMELKNFKYICCLHEKYSMLFDQIFSF